MPPLVSSCNGTLEQKTDCIHTVNSEEVKKFNGTVDWWSKCSSMKPLLSFNEVRVPFIVNGLLTSKGLHCKDLCESPDALQGFKILDIGCGGGILSEGLGKVGASVVGIDPGVDNISMARDHLTDELKARVSYECSVIEDYIVNYPNAVFDGIVMSEVVEHVENPMDFIVTSLKLLKPGGSLFITAPNRTMASWMACILMAEYILRILPVGTHEWKKFITPQEIQKVLKSNGLKIMSTTGVTYNPMTDAWKLISYQGVQYALHAIKSG